MERKREGGKASLRSVTEANELYKVSNGRKRRYPLAFVSKLSDSEAEAAETQTWLQFSVKCGNLSAFEAKSLYKDYDAIIGMLVSMITHSDQWKLQSRDED